MRIKEILKQENEHGVWEAIVEIKDISSPNWLTKQSTFFPKDWSISQLFNECEFAVQNPIRLAGKQNVYGSKTRSGIPVRIIIKDEQLISIYPTLS